VTTVDFLAYLQSLEIQLVIEDDRLRCIAPAGVLTPELRAVLADRKTELLAFLQPTQSQTAELSLKPTPREPHLPLSFAQQRLWFLHQLTPDNPFYNIPAAIRLRGELDIAALERSFNEIVRRHEALRTNFGQINQQPVQKIIPEASFSLPVIDLQSVPEQDREGMTKHLSTAEARRSFDLSADPLLRVCLLQFSATDFVLLLTLHHIVADGWSLGVLIRELTVLYTASIQGTPASLPTLPIQYADFAAWQRQWLQGEVLTEQLAYWRNQLHEMPGLDLPCDRPRPAMPSYRGATEPIQLSHDLTVALEALSQQENVSLFMTLLAAFQTLLYRHTGQEDITVGSPIANRHHSELEGLIGFFVNSLTMRTDLSGNPTFRSLLQRVREVALGAYAHQDLPFEKLVEELDPERDLSRNPLFQVVFALQNAPIEPLELPGLRLEPLPFDAGTVRFDLEFHLWERHHGLSQLWQTESEGLSGFVAYSTDLFDRSTIVRMLEQFQTLLAGIVIQPDTRLSDLPLLTAQNYQQILVDWNQTQVAYNRHLCFHQWFEAQVEQFPDEIAVVDGQEQITYAELNQRANQLAHFLQQLGVHADRLVGLCVDRSLEMTVGILGILKAGGAYVPIDPNYPLDRIQFILADTKVSIVLTQSWLSQKLSACSISLIYLDDRSILQNQSKTTPKSTVQSGHLAYAIYTSGSTGTPKGVLIQHRGLCNVVVGQQHLFHLKPGSRILQFSSLSFDASVFEIAMAFGSGGTLYIVPDSIRTSPPALAQFLRDRAITHAILPPAVLALMPEAHLPTLQTLVAGGEACSQEVVDRWAVDRQFWNAYGPTEATIWATAARLTAGNPITIGRPVANTKVYLLDAHLQPVSVGVTGELYIAGDGVARGYLHRPELTQERFINNPFDNASCYPKLYKTGDSARYRSDGSIEFLGRVDHQIKIRGFRIEPGEIDVVLSQHPLVQTAITIAHPPDSADRQLVTYLTLSAAADTQMLKPSFQNQHIEHWRTLYDQTYQQASADPRFDTTGWNRSDTGQPIPIEQMQEWVNDRVQTILQLSPQSVLEIGCGTGLLLFQIAPHCQKYWATDFSTASLDRIQAFVAPPSPEALPQVKLLAQTAIDFSQIPAAAFDTVILNSIVQYFPSLDYLSQVIAGSTQTILPNGVLFIGDVRSLPLLSAFHTSVQFHQASATLDRSQLQHQIQRAMFEETELVIDPAFFAALPEQFPQIHHVQIQLLQGRSPNEMNQFRYNVLLHFDPALPRMAADQVDWINWTNQMTVASIRQRLAEARPEILGITNIPNARIASAIQLTKWLSSATAPKTVGRMREALESLSFNAIEPQDWWDLAAEQSYRVEVCWSPLHPGHYDVCLIRADVPTQVVMPFLEAARSQSCQHYSNRPLQAEFVRQWIPQLRTDLAQKLPDYMIPALFIILETLPLTRHGKIDRLALPSPDGLKLTSTYTAPRSPTEEALVKIWMDLLRLKQVGIHDNFFELGGHSLLATQLASRIRDTFSIEIPLRTLFESPTILQLASVIDAIQISHVSAAAPALVPLDRTSRRRLRSSIQSAE
jgi:amino acid adenylation domain-containing protein